MEYQKKKTYNCLQLYQLKKIPNSCDAKEYYQSFVRQKNTKSVKESKINTQQSKAFENPNTVDIK